MYLTFIHAFLLAIGLIMPLGVQNVFIFNQGIYHRKWTDALPVVVTASVCDNLLVLTAVCGVSLVVLKIALIKYLLGIAGAVFLLYMSYATWNNNNLSLENQDETEKWPLKRQILFTITVSILNPHAIVDTIGVIGTSSLAYKVTAERITFTVTTMLVSWLWFLFLMSAGHLMGKMNNKTRIQTIINRVSAVIMLFSAGVLLKMLFW